MDSIEILSFAFFPIYKRSLAWKSLNILSYAVTGQIAAEKYVLCRLQSPFKRLLGAKAHYGA
jgi:hypothetical protein